MRLSPRDPAWVLTLFVAGTALAIALTLTLSRLLVPSERAVIDTQTWGWTPDGVVVEPVTADSPFRAGDLVVAMAGRPIEAWAADAVALPGAGRATLGDAVTYDVIRGGQRLTIETGLLPFPSERLQGAPIGLVGFGLGAMLLGVVLVVRRPRATALRILFVAVSANTADLVAWELDLQPSDLALRSPFVYAFAAASAFHLVFWSALVHLLSTYPARSRLVIRSRVAVPLVYLGPQVALAILLVVARLAGGGILDWIDRMAAVVAIVASAMIALLIGATIAGYRRTPQPRRRQVRTIAATLLLAAGATLGLVALPIVVSGQPLVPRATVAILALPVLVAVAAAVVRDRLFQVDLLARSRERIVAAREEERRRLRRDLHDGLGPTLAAIGLKLDLARDRARTEPAAVGPVLDELRSDVRAAIAQVRTIARELRPPTLDALGLVGAIRQQADGMGGSVNGGPVPVVETAEDLPPLSAAVEVAAYRIAVEAMTNVIRHAAATRCTVRLALDRDTLEIVVSDDGGGLTGRAVGVGTRSMAERAAEVGGEVTFEPEPGGGTRVVARLPVGHGPDPGPRSGPPDGARR